MTRIIIAVGTGVTLPSACARVASVIAAGNLSTTRGIPHPCAVTVFKDGTTVYCTPNRKSLRFTVFQGEP